MHRYEAATEPMRARRWAHGGGPVRRAALSFAAMYGLMYAMLDRLDNVYPNLNQLYMAGLMTACRGRAALLADRARQEAEIRQMKNKLAKLG